MITSLSSSNITDTDRGWLLKYFKKIFYQIVFGQWAGHPHIPLPVTNQDEEDWPTSNLSADCREVLSEWKHLISQLYICRPSVKFETKQSFICFSLSPLHSLDCMILIFLCKIVSYFNCWWSVSSPQHQILSIHCSNLEEVKEERR